jgi:hypothetical protein
MGAANYVVLERKIEDLDTFMSGKALSEATFGDECEKTLDQISEELGIAMLSSFISASLEEMLGYMEYDIDDAPQDVIATLPPEEWFEPTKGLAVARALISYLEAHPTVVPHSDWVIADLQEIDRILSAAEENNVRWHLAVDC